jgi:hypothetical protein
VAYSAFETIRGAGRSPESGAFGSAITSISSRRICRLEFSAMGGNARNFSAFSLAIEQLRLSPVLFHCDNSDGDDGII